MQVKVDQAGNA